MKTALIETTLFIIPFAGIVYAVFASSYGVGVVSFIALGLVIKMSIK